MRECTTVPEVVARLYDLSGGLRFLHTSLSDDACGISGILRLMQEDLELCAAYLDDLPPERLGGGGKE